MRYAEKGGDGVGDVSPALFLKIPFLEDADVMADMAGHDPRDGAGRDGIVARRPDPF